MDAAFILLFLAAGLAVGAVFWAIHRAKAPERERRARRLADAVRVNRGAEKAQATIRRQPRRERGGGLDQRLRGLTPSLQVLERRLTLAGLKITVTEYLLAVSAAATLLALAAASLTRMPLLFSILFGLGFGMGLPHMALLYIEGKRARKIVNQLPDALDAMVRAVKAGLPASQAMFSVGDEIADPLGAEFKNVSQQVRLGKSIGEALNEASDRLQVPEFNFLVITLVLQQETGGNLAETLANLSDIIRRRHQLRLKVKALSSEAKASAYIVGALPFVMSAGLTLLNPAYMGKLFTDPRGTILLGAAGIMFMAGVGTMWRMVRFDF